METDYSELVSTAANQASDAAIKFINSSDIENPGFDIYFLTALEIALTGVMNSCQKANNGISNLPFSTMFLAGLYFSALHSNEAITVAESYLDSSIYRMFTEVANAVYCDIKVYYETMSVLKGMDDQI